MTGDAARPKLEKPGRRILQNSSWLLGAKIVAAALSTVYLALVARTLGASDFGTFALILSFAQLVTGLVAFQTWQIIIRYGTAHALDGAIDRMAQLVWVCLGLDLLGIFIGVALAVGGSLALAQYFNWDPQLGRTAMLFSVAFIFSARATPTGLLRVHDRFRDAALSDTLVPIIRFAGVLAALMWFPTLEAFLWVWVASEVMTTAIYWVFVVRTVPLALRAHSPRHILQYAKAYPHLLQYATWLNLGSSMKLAGQQGIVLAVGLFAGSASAGFFRLGHQLGQVLARVADALSFSVFAEYSRVTHRDGGDATASLIARTIKVTVISAAIFYALLLVCGKWLILQLFGSEFAPAFPFVLLLGGAAAVQVGATALEPALLSRGHAGRVLAANFFGTLIIVVAGAVLMPPHAALGAAFAVLLGTITTALALGFYFRRMPLPIPVDAASDPLAELSAAPR